VIFMPIFIPLLAKFNIDPLFFGLLVALNLQTAFLSPPVAMAAFYLKGVAPPHVTLNQIFGGMMPFMGIQVIALILLYMFPESASGCRRSSTSSTVKSRSSSPAGASRGRRGASRALRRRAQRRGPPLAAEELAPRAAGARAHDHRDGQGRRLGDRRAPDLQVIANIAVGYNNVDVAGARRGIRVTNTPGVLDDTTADLTWALLMAAARRVAEGDATCAPATGRSPSACRSSSAPTSTTPRSASSGWGASAARSRAARRDSTCASSTTTARRCRDAERAHRRHVGDLDALLAESDFVVAMVPYSPATPPHDRGGANREDEAHGDPGEFGPRRCRGRRGAGRGASSAAHRGCRPDVFEGEPRVNPGLPRPAQRRAHAPYRQRLAGHAPADVRDGGSEPHRRAGGARASHPVIDSFSAFPNRRVKMSAKVAFVGLGVMGIPHGRAT
jgi:hypothetical protein